MLSTIQNGTPLSFRDRLRLTLHLSWPAIVAQLSTIMMQYIDAAMVGRLGANPSAAVGLMATTLWMFWGVCSAATVGFSVLVAHRIGAGDKAGAQDIFRRAIPTCFLFGLMMALIGVCISGDLPYWLGGSEEINGMASVYFMIFASALPLLTLNYLGSGMCRCSGNMKVPGAVNVGMCFLDVIFNLLLIFPHTDFRIGDIDIHLPGAGLGVAGAALGTACAEVCAAVAIMWWATRKEENISIFGKKTIPVSCKRRKFLPTRSLLKKAFRISVPMIVEHIALTGAQIITTVIVAPLGVIAIAANSFAVTAEALCYMPGYGIADAATTLVGQSHGAKRPHLARQFGYLTVGMGMVGMTVMGVLMWVGAPALMELFTPVRAIQEMGISALRIEAWAEPMFAASIVAYGVMVGVGDTIIPAIMNFGSIWLVRIPLAALLAPSYGLNGVWIGMCIELCFRGAIFLIRLCSGRWLKTSSNKKS